MSGAAGDGILGWLELAAAFAVFLASHAVPVRPALRRPLARRLGESGFLVGYSLVSVAALAWLIVAAGRAPYVELWPFASWQHWVPVLVMPLACLLVAFGTAVPNPLSFGGRANQAFRPEGPGMIGLARHPLLLAIMLWAAAHAVPNGDLAHLLLFGSLGGFALLGMAVLDRRRRAQLGAARWQQLAAHTALARIAAVRWPLPPAAVAGRIALAVLLYLGLLLAHPLVIGIPALPQP